MSFHSPVHPPSRHTLVVAQLAILATVILTAMLSALIVKGYLEQYEIYPDQIPIADMNVWEALSH